MDKHKADTEGADCTPKGDQIEKENHLNQTSMTLGSMFIFQGVLEAVLHDEQRTGFEFTTLSEAMSSSVTDQRNLSWDGIFEEFSSS